MKPLGWRKDLVIKVRAKSSGLYSIASAISKNKINSKKLFSNKIIPNVNKN